MENKRIAFQGEPGAYSEQALFLLEPHAESQPYREFRDVAEVVSSVHHCLLGVAGASRESLRRVLSHPVALAQCERFLRQLAGVDVVAFYDTAGAAAEVARQGDRSLAAIAGALEAQRYGLTIMAERIEDEPHNQTRFLLVAAEPASPPPGVPAKTTLLLKLPHRPGTLARALAPLAAAGLNLTKLESRPDRTTPWEYLFYLDIEARAADPAMAGAIRDLEAQGAVVIVLGDYPRFTPRAAPP